MELWPAPRRPNGRARRQADTSREADRRRETGDSRETDNLEQMTPTTTPAALDPTGAEERGGAAGGGRLEGLREFLHHPIAAFSLTALAVIGAAVWPRVISAVTGHTVADRTQATLTGALVAAGALWGALECLRGAEERRGDRRSAAWLLFGAGGLAWAVGAAVAVMDGVAPVGGPGLGTATGFLQFAGSAAVLAGTMLIPADSPPTLLRRIDLSLVLTAVLVALWAVAVPLMLDRPPDSTSRAAIALMGAAWIVSSASVTMRAPPHHHSEVRGLVWALLAGGLASILTANGFPEHAVDLRSGTADLLWLIMGLTLAVSARRLRHPWVYSSDVTRAADRLHGWLPGTATVAALAIVAVAQYLGERLDPMMMTLGALVVVLSGARGLLMHVHNQSLFKRLMRIADELGRTSRRDDLTGLGNRLALEERLGQALRRQPPEGVSVFFIDIDNFKGVNDSLGHDSGDDLLQVLADRLVGVLGADVFRVGGDEFVAVREDLDGRSAEAVAAAIVAALGPPVQIGAHRVPSGASVGMARSEPRQDGDRRPDDPHLLLRRADLALYRAKELGRGQWAAYEPWLQERADRRLSLQQGLHEALADGQIEVFYQPVVHLRSGELAGAEALVRWVSPAFGVLLPHEFVPLAHEAALMPAIGEQVLHTVLGHMAGSPGEHLWVAVNLSEDEVVHPGTVERFRCALADSGVDPTRLHVEVTERIVLDPAARSVLNALADLGIRICIEDFGSGPTSLRYLSGFSALTLKIDRSFLGAIGRSRDDRTILAAVVDLAHELGLGVAAEAITTERQAEELLEMGIEEGQGWHFGQAVRWPELLRGQGTQEVIA